MRIFILTQEDAFYIPRLIGRFDEEKSDTLSIVGAAILKGEIAAKNVGAYFKLLGLLGFVQNGFFFAIYKALDLIDRYVFPLDKPYSVVGALNKLGVTLYYPSNINSDIFYDLLERLEVDLLVSIACPQIVREELLKMPPKGVVNIHGALLPKYRGKLPSFWVLANNEEKTGVTVHFMSRKLDDGPIILQEEVPINSDDTLHSLILKSKVDTGGRLLAHALSLIEENRVELKENDAAYATYYSFPTSEAISAFRRLGRRIR